MHTRNGPARLALLAAFVLRNAGAHARQPPSVALPAARLVVRRVKGLQMAGVLTLL
jgi:hypothetical protein